MLHILWILWNSQFLSERPPFFKGSSENPIMPKILSGFLKFDDSLGIFLADDSKLLRFCLFDGMLQTRFVILRFFALSLRKILGKWYLTAIEIPKILSTCRDKCLFFCFSECFQRSSRGAKILFCRFLEGFFGIVEHPPLTLSLLIRSIEMMMEMSECQAKLRLIWHTTAILFSEMVGWI